MACLRTDIYELVGESSIVSLVSLFAPLTLGLYWKKSTAMAAVASMFTGILSWLVFKFYPIGLPELVPATYISFFTMVTVSLVNPKP